MTNRWKSTSSPDSCLFLFPCSRASFSASGVSCLNLVARLSLFDSALRLEKGEVRLVAETAVALKPSDFL
jgi:hypothetical protein